jgi:hypothetical protein
MKRYLPHLGIALGLALAIYALFFSESDEDKIRAVLDHLEVTIRVSPDDTNMVVRMAHIKGEFKEIFSKEVSFDIPELSNMSAGRTELAGLAAKAPQMWRTATVDLSDVGISVDEGATGAVAVGHAVLDATRHNGQLHRDTRQVSISVEKIEGEWRIVGMTVSAKDETS